MHVDQGFDPFDSQWQFKFSSKFSYFCLYLIFGKILENLYFKPRIKKGI